MVSLTSVSGIPAGNNNFLGNTGGASAEVSANPVLTVAGAYVAGDYVGTSGVPMHFVDVARIVGGSGFIKGKILDSAKQSAPGELWLFNDVVTPPADNAPWSISDADMLKWAGTFPFNVWYPSALNAGSIADMAVWFRCIPTSKDLYGCYVTRAAPTYASLDITAILNVLQN